jgi:hypothetical protein
MKKPKPKHPPKNVANLEKPTMHFDEFARRIVRVKPEEIKPKRD